MIACILVVVLGQRYMIVFERDYRKLFALKMTQKQNMQMIDNEKSDTTSSEKDAAINHDLVFIL
jgi:hypothetical protein